MDDKTKLIIDRINYKLQLAKERYNENAINSYDRHMNEIDGLCDALSIILDCNTIITDDFKLIINNN